MRKGANLCVHWNDGDVSYFISAVTTLQFTNQIHRAFAEEFFSVFKIVFLVFLNGG